MTFASVDLSPFRMLAPPIIYISNVVKVDVADYKMINHSLYVPIKNPRVKRKPNVSTMKVRRRMSV